LDLRLYNDSRLLLKKLALLFVQSWHRLMAALIPTDQQPRAA